MAATHLSVRKVLFSTTELTDGDLSTATLLGTLAADSEIPEPEGQFDAFMSGEAEVGAVIELNLRILGSGGAGLTTLQTGKDANPPTEYWLYFPNRSLTAATRFGSAIIKQAYTLGDGNPARRQSFRVRARVENDTAELVVKRFSGAITLPA